MNVTDIPSRQRRPRLSGTERRAKILAAATRLFAERGYHAVSMEEIAEAAGSWKAVVYDHFPSKVELYVALLESFRDQLLVATASASTEGHGREARLRASFEAFFVFVEERPDAVRLLFLETPGEPELARAHAGVQSGAALAIAKTLASDPALLSAESGRGQALEMLATMIKGAVHALAAWWREHPAIPRPEIVEQATRLVWGGVEELYSDSEE